MITAVTNLSTVTMSIDMDDDKSQLLIGFSDETEVVEFDDLSFGWKLSANGEEVSSKVYPEEGVIYVQTDQPFISADTLPVFLDTPMVLNVWTKNAGTLVSEVVEWTTLTPVIEEILEAGAE